MSFFNSNAEDKEEVIANNSLISVSALSQKLEIDCAVLRDWEKKFVQINPIKAKGNRRLYDETNVKFIKKIHHLIYCENYTISQIQSILQSKIESSGIDLNEQEEAYNNVLDYSTEFSDIDHKTASNKKESDSDSGLSYEVIKDKTDNNAIESKQNNAPIFQDDTNQNANQAGYDAVLAEIRDDLNFILTNYYKE